MMSVELVLLALVVVLLLAVLFVLLTRKPGADPTIPLLQAAQERQGERIAALGGEVKAALSATETVLAREMSALTSQTMQVQGAAAQAQKEDAAALRAEVAEKLARINLMVEQVRAALTESQSAMKTAIAAEMAAARDLIDRKATESRLEVETKLKEMREANDKRLADIQASVNEQLGAAVEKQMTESFTRVIDQFNAIQAMMGNVQSVASQVGDLKRLFSNVKTRGGWGEAQLRQMLDDFVPGAYESNVRVREDSSEAVEFAIRMPGADETQPLLPIDSKFPSEDYERLLAAQEAGDAPAEALARRAIEQRVRGEAQKIATKYISAPRTTEYAILFLPTEGLYAEVARIPGLMDTVARQHRVFIAGPFLLPALLKNIQLGYVQYALSKNAEGVRDLLAATKEEMAKMDKVLEGLGRQVGTVSNSIGSARTRTRAIARKLRAVEALPEGRAADVLQLDEATLASEEDEEA
jgi:DNA recombination protein RmuC